MDRLMIPAAGQDLHVVRAGHGRPVVLLHGWPEFWLTWAPVMERLADSFTLIAPDLRGFGDSCAPDVKSTDQVGTDAMRDGVDVPGRALRLVVFDRVPWPRPDILHRERRTHLGGGDPGGYDDRVARMRLRQAFERLVRRATDRGVFVLLDRRMPTRLLSAFPAGVVTRRAGLAEVVAETATFLSA